MIMIDRQHVLIWDVPLVQSSTTLLTTLVSGVEAIQEPGIIYISMTGYCTLLSYVITSSRQCT